MIENADEQLHGFYLSTLCLKIFPTFRFRLFNEAGFKTYTNTTQMIHLMN